MQWSFPSSGTLPFFLSLTLFSNLTISGIAPNIFIIYILFLGLYTNSKVSIGIGIFLGLLLLLVVIVAVIAVVSSVAGAAAAIVDDEDGEEA